MTEKISNRQALDRPYQAIIDQAKPGDVVFFISQKGDASIQNGLKKIYRSWLGFDPKDNTNWHTAVYIGAKKDSKGSRYRPYIIHAVPNGGVVQTIIPPEYFKHTHDKGYVQKSHLEIASTPDLELADREKVVQFCLSQQGKSFDDDERWYRSIATYVLGIKTSSKDPNKISCHGMVFDAYSTIGYRFPHQLSTAPNILGRIIGHPIGHPSNEIDLSSNYLRDHHLYRDNRLKISLAVASGLNIQDAELIHAPEKYSWDHLLQLAYGLLAIK